MGLRFNYEWAYSWKGLLVMFVLGMLLGTQVAALGWCKYFITCTNECKCFGMPEFKPVNATAAAEAARALVPATTGTTVK